MRHRTIGLTVVLVVASLVAATGAVAAGGQASLALAAQENETTNGPANNSTVSAGTGAQVSTVIASASDDVQTEYEERSFEAEFRAGNESERAEAVTDRSAELDARAQAIQEAYENTTRAYENGSISRDEYAQRIATLNARAKNVHDSVEQLDRRADDVPRAELRATGLNGSELNATLETLAAVSGPSQNALLAKFIGESSAEIEIRSADGVRIEVESEDGERSREFRRFGDDSTEITIEQSLALANARTNLSTSAGSWVLSEASVHEEDGEYRFEFLLANGSERGEAEVRVDGSSGDVVRVEEELERPESDEEEDETEDDGSESTHSDLSAETTYSNGAITVTVSNDGEPVAEAVVSLDGDRVGETDANGTLSFDVDPNAEDYEIEIVAGDAEIESTYVLRNGSLVDAEQAEGDAETETETENQTTETDDETDIETRTATATPSAEDVDIDASLDDGTVTLTLTNDGSGIDGASLSVNSDSAGDTDENGVVSFQVKSSEEDYDVRFEKDDMEIRTEYTVADGTIEQTEEIRVK